MKAFISGLVSRGITSSTRRAIMRRVNRRAGPPVLFYFHQVDDPYSHLLVQLLGPLAERYGTKINVYLVPPPDAAAAPERERLRLYGLRDARRLARAHCLSLPERASPPAAEDVAKASGLLAQSLDLEIFKDRAFTVGEALWGNNPLPTGPAVDPSAVLEAGQALRARLGHYLGGVLHFEGEWYWGVDRLHYLEDRLAERIGGVEAPHLAPYRELSLPPVAPSGRAPVIELWFSFRSPYSWIAFPRMRRLASHYGADLKLRYILPMVMRGLPVPPQKRRYIVFDVKREADRLGLPFGPMVDPVGVGVERAVAVLHRAVSMGLGDCFAERALRAIWAEGADLTSDSILKALAADAGLSHGDVELALQDNGWREAVEANRCALLDAGLWGAPTFRVNGGIAHWGQDRLWALEEDILSVLAAS